MPIAVFTFGEEYARITASFSLVVGTHVGVDNPVSVRTSIAQDIAIQTKTSELFEPMFGISCKTVSEIEVVFGFGVDVPEILILNVDFPITINVPESLVPQTPQVRPVPPTQSIGGTPANPIEINHPAGAFDKCDYAVYFNSTLITEKIIESVTINIGPDVFDTIEFSTNDKNVRRVLDNYDQDFSKHRIYVVVGSDLYAFILEDRQKEQHGKMRLWGRSVAALYDAPYAPELTISVSDDPVYMGDIIESLPLGKSVSWEIMGFMVPKNTSFYGTPIKILQDMAASTMGVVRNTKDGRIVVRYPFPESPPNIDKNPAVKDFSGDTLFRIGEQATKNGGYQTVRVIGYQKPDITPIIKELDDLWQPILSGTRQNVVGEDMDVAVFLPYTPPTFSDSEIDVSGGPNGIWYISNGNWRIKEEVTVRNGVGASSLPISHMMEFTPISGYAGYATAAPYDMEFTVEQKNYTGKGMVWYITHGLIYRVYGDRHVDSTEIIASHFPLPLVDVKIQRSGGEPGSEAAPIMENLITNTKMAIVRAIAFFVEYGYNTYTVPIRFPYTEGLAGNDVIYINEPDIGVAGNYMLESAKVTLNGPQYIMEGTAKRWS